MTDGTHTDSTGADATPPKTEQARTPARPPVDEDAANLYEIAEQKRALAKQLLENDDPTDDVDAKRQEVQAAQLHDEARARAETTGTKPPDEGILP